MKHQIIYNILSFFRGFFIHFLSKFDFDSFPRSITTKVTIEKNTMIEAFQMFMSSQESSHRLKMLQFNTNGVLIKATRKNPGYKVFNLKIHEHLRLENDPKVQCRNYQNPRDFIEVQKLCF